MAAKKPTIYLFYDYDRTLGKDRSISDFVFSIALASKKGREIIRGFYPESYRERPLETMDDFWDMMTVYQLDHQMESYVLTYMEMLKDLHREGVISIKDEDMRALAKNSKQFQGLPDFMYAIPDLYKDEADIHQAIVSGGPEEMIRGTVFGEAEKEGLLKIIGPRFNFGSGRGILIETMEPSMKVQVMSRLAKGGNYTGNDKVPRDLQLVQQGNLIFFTDSKSDTQPAVYVNAEGGRAIFVYDTDYPERKRIIEEQMPGRYYDILPADYRTGKKVYKTTVETIDEFIERTAASLLSPADAPLN